MWQYPEVQTLCRRFYVTKLHMCRYGMQLPGSDNLIKKSTKLLVSDEDMVSLGKTRPGEADPAHVSHDVIAGHHKGVGSISAFASRYPPQFVQAVLELVPRFHEHEVLIVEHDDVSNEQWNQIHEVCVLPVLNQPLKWKSSRR